MATGAGVLCSLPLLEAQSVRHEGAEVEETMVELTAASSERV